MLNQEGKSLNRDIWKFLLLIAMALYIGIKDVVSPLVSDVTGKTSRQTELRIEELTTIRQQLSTFAYSMATSEEAIRTLKIAVDKIDRKIDAHMALK